MDDMSRREFLALSAGAAGALPLGSPSDAARAQAPAPGASATTDRPGLIAPAWCDRPMRWAQLTLVENDPGHFDPQFWLDYFRRIHADAACLSAGGIVAYYPTAVPLHHRSAWLGTSDPFGTLLEGCRRLGMQVIARTDPHAVRDEVQRAHPDWIAVTADGKPRRHWANPELWVTCALGPYNFEFMTAVHREIVARYRVDGIFSNRWAGHGQCWCEHCRENFRAATGLDLPTSQDTKDRARREYIVWSRERLTALWKHWDMEIRTINPDACFIPNGPPDLRTAGELAPIQFADHQARRGLTPPWANARRAKEYRAVMGRRPVGGIFSVGLEEPWRWKDSVQADAEVRIWAAEGTAAGMRPWFTKFSGVLYDRRWLETVERIYAWHHRNEKYLRNECSLARVAMLVSEQTAVFHGGAPHQERHGDHAAGMYHALVEARIPFDMVHEAYLTPERLDRYRVLVLANAAALSDEQCAALASYVARGGRIVATFETSLYDEFGRRRGDFGLADLFGVSIAGEVEGPMRNSYLSLEADPATGRRHAILDGLEKAPRIINGVWRLPVAPRGAFPSPMTLIPSYPDLPMEDVYPRVTKTDERAVYMREAGPGRVAYFPWDIDRTFHDVLNPDHGQVLANAIRWAADEPPVVSVGGRGIVDVAVWRQQASMTVHLVNLTNPMMMKGPFRELLPIGPLEVQVHVPSDAHLGRIRLLTADRTLAIRRDADGALLVTVPEVLDHEVVAIETG